MVGTFLQSEIAALPDVELRKHEFPVMVPVTQAATLDFGSSVFSPGTQRPPFDPKLFGTDATGTAIDQAVATLDLFDGLRWVRSRVNGWPLPIVVGMVVGTCPGGQPRSLASAAYL